jgi:hypothetical protein
MRDGIVEGLNPNLGFEMKLPERNASVSGRKKVTRERKERWGFMFYKLNRPRFSPLGPQI